MCWLQELYVGRSLTNDYLLLPLFHNVSLFSIADEHIYPMHHFSVGAMKDMKGALKTNSFTYTDGNSTVCISFIRFMLEQLNK